ncbi:MAG: hypothetical protein ACYCS0_05950 [bacterium]
MPKIADRKFLFWMSRLNIDGSSRIYNMLKQFQRFLSANLGFRIYSFSMEGI